jgi:DMSO/TMAO reductase YedYZ molybdopterin-dependent catalytic subunit
MRGAACLATLLLCAAPAAAQVKIDGLVDHPQTLSGDQLKAFPATQVEASFATMHGTLHHRWTGALLWDVVNKAGLRDEPGKRTAMRHSFLIIGADGYAATLAIGEIEPGLEGKQVILAYHQNDPPSDLPAPKLIVPGDRKGARQIHDVVEIEVR